MQKWMLLPLLLFLFREFVRPSHKLSLFTHMNGANYLPLMASRNTLKRVFHRRRPGAEFAYSVHCTLAWQVRMRVPRPLCVHMRTDAL
jgi:hypothetical protein